MTNDEVWIGMNLSIDYKGVARQGKVVAIDGKAYKVKLYVRAPGSKITKTTYVWLGEGAMVAKAKDTVVRKKKLVGLVSTGLTLAGLVFFFNPQVSMIIDVLKSLLENFQ